MSPAIPPGPLDSESRAGSCFSWHSHIPRGPPCLHRGHTGEHAGPTGMSPIVMHHTWVTGNLGEPSGSQPVFWRPAFGSHGRSPCHINSSSQDPELIRCYETLEFCFLRFTSHWQNEVLVALPSHHVRGWRGDFCLRHGCSHTSCVASFQGPAPEGGTEERNDPGVVLGRLSLGASGFLFTSLRAIHRTVHETQRMVFK